MLGLTVVDLALLAMALLSGLLAMYRGFTREVLSITSWVVAGLAVLYFVQNHKKFAEEMAQQMGAPVTIAQIVLGAVLFLLVLIIVHLVTARISDAMLDSRIGMIDRFFGLLFGVARGYLIILIAFMGYQLWQPKPEQQFDFVAKAASRNLLMNSANALQPVVQLFMEKVQSRARGDQQGFINLVPRGGVTLAHVPRYHVSGARARIESNHLIVLAGGLA